MEVSLSGVHGAPAPELVTGEHKHATVPAPTLLPQTVERLAPDQRVRHEAATLICVALDRKRYKTS